jgi:hypothetical protein
VTTAPAATTEFSHRYTAQDGCAGCDPDVSFNHNGLCDHGGMPLERFNWMAQSDDAHVRTDHHIMGDTDASEVVHSRRRCRTVG